MPSQRVNFHMSRDAALTLAPDDEQLLQPALRGRLVGTDRTDGQEAMVRRSSCHVQPQHSSGAVVEHGGRGASTAAQAAAEAACEAGRRPVVPVVRQERLKSSDSARRTAGVLPSLAGTERAPADVRRRFVRCRRALSATPKVVRALGPSCITLSGGLAPVCRVERGRSEWVSRLEPRSIEIVAKPRTSMSELIEATSV